jgi:hypothetical protein
VLAGGRRDGKICKEVWVSDVDDVNWKLVLPPLSKGRCKPLLVNTGSPEYLIVLDGKAITEKLGLWHERSVEVLLENQWLSLNPLPTPFTGVGPLVFNSNFYLSVVDACIGCCTMKSLVDACVEVTNSGRSTTSGPEWKRLTLPNWVYDKIQCCPLAAYKNRLIGLPNFGLVNSSVSVYAHHPLTKSWLRIGASPKSDNISNITKAATVLPTGEFIVINDNRDNATLHKASTKGMLYHLYRPYECFNYCSAFV